MATGENNNQRDVKRPHVVDSSLDSWLLRGSPANAKSARADSPPEAVPEMRAPKRRRQLYGAVTEPAPLAPTDLHKYWSPDNREAHRRAKYLEKLCLKSTFPGQRRLLPLHNPLNIGGLVGMYLSSDGIIKLVGTGLEEYCFDRFRDDLQEIDINCDDTRIYGTSGNIIHSMEVALCDATSRVAEPLSFPYIVERLAAHPSNPNSLAIGSHVGSVHVVDVRCAPGGKTVCEVVDSPSSFAAGQSKESISAITWSDEYHIASAQRDSEIVRFWDVRYANKRGVNIVRSIPNPRADDLTRASRTGITDLVTEESGIVWALSRSNAIFSCHAASERPILRVSSPGYLNVSKFQTRMSLNRKAGLLACGGDSGAIVMTLPPLDAHYVPQPVSLKGIQVAHPADATRVLWTADNCDLMVEGRFWTRWGLRCPHPARRSEPHAGALPLRSIEVPIVAEEVRYLTSM